MYEEEQLQVCYAEDEDYAQDWTAADLSLRSHKIHPAQSPLILIIIISPPPLRAAVRLLLASHEIRLLHLPLVVPRLGPEEPAPPQATSRARSPHVVDSADSVPDHLPHHQDRVAMAVFLLDDVSRALGEGCLFCGAPAAGWAWCEWRCGCGGEGAGVGGVGSWGNSACRCAVGGGARRLGAAAGGCRVLSGLSCGGVRSSSSSGGGGGGGCGAVSSVDDDLRLVLIAIDLQRRARTVVGILDSRRGTRVQGRSLNRLVFGSSPRRKSLTI
ncbi:uncharacterized protein IWZ02DRAFT_102832 [Phyllosticta citriasiana]|uniref:uncharacterized protein n=1 Tax=Phyllosticta citriasiana TaxID=595635 RepID=UPI0030FD8926